MEIDSPRLVPTNDPATNSVRVRGVSAGGGALTPLAFLAAPLSDTPRETMVGSPTKLF